jgi:transcriptional regulator
MDKVRDVLEKRGYFLVSTSENSLALNEYRKRKIHIFLYSKEELFKVFNIIFNSTDKNHKGYYK